MRPSGLRDEGARAQRSRPAPSARKVVPLWRHHDVEPISELPRFGSPASADHQAWLMELRRLNADAERLI